MPDETPPDVSAIPADLRNHDQWVCWKTQDRDGKQTKVPVDPATGAYASTNDESTWATFDSAYEHAQRESLGLGFVFDADDTFVGVDLDGCRDADTGRPEPWARQIVSRLDSYTEVSPSGTGYHVIVQGDRPGGPNRRGSVEVYDHRRFFTVTGRHERGTPTEIRPEPDGLVWLYETHLDPNEEKDSERETRRPGSTPRLSDEHLLYRARSAKNGAKFDRLWRGSTAGYESNSEADMALCSLLAFWTGGDAGQIDRLFRNSGLHRAKWDDVHYADGSTYGEKTIERAIAGTKEFYTPRSRSRRDAASTADGEKRDHADELIRELERLREREEKRRARVETLEQRVADLEAENERLRTDRQSHSKRPSGNENQNENTTPSIWLRLLGRR
jgi:primase-polymerase (primpol)-like protein